MKGKAQAPLQPPAVRAARFPQRKILAMAVLAALGLGISVYLTLVHYSRVPLVCLAAGTGCEEVNRSLYSEVAGIAVALFGAAAYAAILAALWAERSGIVKGEEAALGLFGVSLLGVLYSAYLTYVEIFILRAICSWCVISALAMSAIFVLAFIRLRGLIRAGVAG